MRVKVERANRAFDWATNDPYLFTGFRVWDGLRSHVRDANQEVQYFTTEVLDDLDMHVKRHI